VIASRDKREAWERKRAAANGLSDTESAKRPHPLALAALKDYVKGLTLMVTASTRALSRDTWTRLCRLAEYFSACLEQCMAVLVTVSFRSPIRKITARCFSGSLAAGFSSPILRSL
jgi:hypothetical protein